MHYHIDKTAAQSAYLQLYHQLRRDIVSGVYPLGTKMPSKRLIATETGVSVITVEHALAILCDEGYLESRERSGFFVSFAAADCFPVSETETERRTTVSHGTEDEFPFPSLAQTMRRVLSEYGESILVKSPNNGCAELRGAIAAYLSRSRGISVQPGQIVIGSGAEYLYGLIVQLLGRERVFALEDPSYDKIRRVYQAHGVTCEMLRLGSDGIRSDELTRASATVLHVTPFHSFPSQVTASAGKRREYLRWAEEREGYIVEDDFDSEFSVSSKSEDTLFALEPERSVIYMNTFSKTIAPKVQKIEMQILPPEHIKDYLEAADRRGLLPMFYLELVTGLRKGEITALLWSDLDIQNKTISVSKQYVKNPNGELTLSRPKTETSVRKVSIPQEAVDLLIAEHGKHPENPYMFPSPATGEMYYPDSVVNLHKKILKDAGLPHIRFHDLRHTFATLALQNGVDVKTVSSMLGHYDAGFTLRTYTHAMRQKQDEAAQTMGSFMAQVM